ncbi:hypothetical protein HYY74_00190 [Candidatus Woesearchaeota archaeon]|nr:hypothetical protein [Candidatus Woesearchaeota archaeon]
MNCTVYTNFTGSWASNVTAHNISSETSVSQNNHTISLNHNTVGTYQWSVLCLNFTDGSVSAWAPSNWTFTLT